MKKILVALLVLIALGLNTSNVGAFTDSQTNKTNAYYLKIDKILNKFFIKVDKKGEEKAKIIYKKIINKIDVLVKKSKSDKKTKILNYIKVKFVDKLEKKKIIDQNTIKADKVKTKQEKNGIEVNSGNQTFNNEGTSQSNLNIGTNKGKQLLQKKFFSGNEAEVQRNTIAYDPGARIQSLVGAYDSLLGVSGNQARLRTFINNPKMIKEVTRRAAASYNVYMSMLLDGEAVNVTDASHYSFNENSRFSFNVSIYRYLTLAPTSNYKRIAFENAGYRAENGKLVYKEELNNFKKQAIGRDGYVNVDTLKFIKIK